METPKAVLITLSAQVENGKVNMEARFVTMGLVKYHPYLLNEGQIGQR